MIGNRLQKQKQLIAADQWFNWRLSLFSRLLFALALLPLIAGCTLSLSNANSQREEASAEAAIEQALGDDFINVTGMSDFTKADLRFAREAQVTALLTSSVGQPVIWRNQSSGNYGQVTPGQAYSVNGLMCRDYQHIVFVNEKSQEKRATACRNPEGVWQILSA